MAETELICSKEETRQSSGI